jgi:hypothetical protein
MGLKVFSVFSFVFPEIASEIIWPLEVSQCNVSFFPTIKICKYNSKTVAIFYF